MVASLLAAQQTPWVKPLHPPCPDGGSHPWVCGHTDRVLCRPRSCTRRFLHGERPLSAAVPVLCQVPAQSLPTDVAAAAWEVLVGSGGCRCQSQVLPGCGMLPARQMCLSAPWAMPGWMETPSGAAPAPRSAGS